MHRACRDQNLGFLVPGAIYGPSPNTDRTLGATSFNGAMVKGVRGELAEFAAFPINWVFVEDVARVALAAVDEDRVGACYVAAGRSEDERALALFCNTAAEMAGSPHRVTNKPLSEIASNLESRRQWLHVRMRHRSWIRGTPRSDVASQRRRLPRALTARSARYASITGDENVHSVEVERAITQMPGVGQVAVIDIPARAGSQLQVAKFSATLRKKLAGYKYPKTNELWTEPLPTLGNKVSKLHLRQEYAAMRRKAPND